MLVEMHAIFHHLPARSIHPITPQTRTHFEPSYAFALARTLERDLRTSKRACIILLAIALRKSIPTIPNLDLGSRTEC
jgi:hypothetical protein